MQAVAIMKQAHISPQKARLVADQVRSLPVGRALDLLKFSNKKAAPSSGKCWNRLSPTPSTIKAPMSTN